MNQNQTSSRGNRTPHLGPLPFPRGEEEGSRTRGPNSAAISQTDTDGRNLSSSGGEDQGEGVNACTVRRGRTLRKKATWAEKILWSRLRNRRLAGFKFRRQHAIGRYELDFYCAQARLAVELDGRGHGNPGRQAVDKRRDALPAKLGIKVLRFWNHAVRENLRSVLDTIRCELVARSPHLDPLPFSRGEEKRSRTRGPKSAVNAQADGCNLSPTGGEDQGEGVPLSSPGKHPKPDRKPLLKFIGPENRFAS